MSRISGRSVRTVPDWLGAYAPQPAEEPGRLRPSAGNEFSGGDATLRLGRFQMHAVAVVARGFLVGHLLRAHFVEALGRAEAREGMAFADQLVRVFLVDLATLALPVRTVRAANVRALVPFDAQPAQGIENLLFGLTSRANLVGVFDAQDELATVLTGEAQVEQRDIGGADMGVAGWRRRDTGTDGGHECSRKEDTRFESSGRC